MHTCIECKHLYLETGLHCQSGCISDTIECSVGRFAVEMDRVYSTRGFRAIFSHAHDCGAFEPAEFVSPENMQDE